MTTQNTNQAPEVALPSMPTCLEDVLPPLLAALDAETDNFERAKTEISENEERIAEAYKWIEVARAAADEANAESLAKLKTPGCTPKDVLKQKAKQRGALEDIETFKSVIADVEIEKKRGELKAHQAANAVRSARVKVRDSAIEALKKALADRLPPELFMLVELISEVASSGDSFEFNANPLINSPLEFGLHEVSFVIREAIPGNRHDFGLRMILPPSPSGMDTFGMSPIRTQLLANELQCQEVAQ